MKPYIETDIDTDHALTVDLRKLILDDPYAHSQQMYVPGSGGVWHFQRDQSIFNLQWVDNLERRLGVYVTDAFVFWRAGGYQHPGAHIDTYPRNGVLETVPASLNWVLDQDPTCSMVWYEPWWDADDLEQCTKAAQGQIPHPYVCSDRTNFGTMSYQETALDLLTETHRFSLPNNVVTVCRTNIPHTVHMGSKDRWCISVRFDYRAAPRLWHNLVSRFS